MRKKHAVLFFLFMTGFILALFAYKAFFEDQVRDPSWAEVGEVSAAVPAPLAASPDAPAVPSMTPGSAALAAAPAPADVPDAAPSPEPGTITVRTINRADEVELNPEGAVWDLYPSGEVVAITAEIAKLRAQNPDWVPSAELAQSVTVLSETERLLNAASLDQDALVFEIATQTPGVLSCDREDVLSAVTQSVYRTQGAAVGTEMFTRNLASCLTDPTLRAAAIRALGGFMTAPEIAAIQAQMADPAYDADFAAATAAADLARVSGWLAEAAVPQYPHPPTDTSALAPEEAPQTLVTTEVDAETAQAAARLVAMPDLTPAQKMTLAWFFYASGDAAQADGLFAGVLAAEPQNGDAGRGAVLAKLALHDYRGAEALLPTVVSDAAFAEPVYLMSATQLVAYADRPNTDLSLDPEQAVRIQRAFEESQNADLAENLGWHSFRLSGCGAAQPWWRAALGINADLEGAAYGIAQCGAEDLGTAEMVEIRAAWSGKSPRIAQIFGDRHNTALAQRPAPRPATLGASAGGGAEMVVTDTPTPPVSPGGPRVLTAADAPPPIAAPAAAESAPSAAPAANPAPQKDAPAPQRRQTRTAAAPANAAPAGGTAALAAGWRLLDAGQDAQAAAAFREAASSRNAKTRSDAAYGLSLLALREGDYRAAQAALSQENQSAERRAEISAGILSAQAIDTFRKPSRTALEALDRRKDFAEETPDLMTIRGWSLWHNNRRAQAREVWREAARLGDPGARKALRDARD